MPSAPATLHVLAVLLAISLAGPAEARCQDRTAPRVDWTGCNKRALMLGQSDLTEAVLTRAALGNTDFRNSNLSRARLNEAEMSFSRFEDADLSRADLSKAVGWRANFSRAKLEGANFASADLSRAVFVSATAHAADFSKSELSRADFTRADLTASHACRGFGVASDAGEPRALCLGALVCGAGGVCGDRKGSPLPPSCPACVPRLRN